MPRGDHPVRTGSAVGAGHVPLARVPRPSSVSLREWVVGWWGGGGGTLGRLLRLLTLPLESGFKIGTGFRNRMFDQGILPLQRAPIPVISIGNLTVGGSGKTPFSGWLARELRSRGEKPAVVARGYGQDEMVLHRRWNPDCLVMAQQDRAYGAWKAARKGASVVVLDDGFQHRRLARDLDIVLVAASTPRKVRLLPRGPFREDLSAVKRACVVVLTEKGRTDSSLDMGLRLEPFLREPPVRVSFVPQGWTELDGEAAAGPGGEYLAVCGIGDPDGFARVLADATGRSGEVLSFPDHHDFSWSDVLEIQDRLQGRTLVTTEKDAVKLHSFRQDLLGARVLNLKVEFLEGEERLWRHVQGSLRARPGLE
ncbi:MAG: tetraacyldisaccharide 4'-kinase [Gemmatimonadota bacterium]